MSFVGVLPMLNDPILAVIDPTLMLRDVNWSCASAEVLLVAAPRFLRTPHKPVSSVMRFVDKDGIVHQTSILQDTLCRPMPGLVHIPMERVIVPRRFSVSGGVSEQQEDPTFFDVDIAFAPYLQNWDVWFPNLRRLSEWFPSYKRLDQASRRLGDQLRRDMSMDQLRHHTVHSDRKLWDRLREPRPTLIKRMAQRFDPQYMIQPHLPLSVITAFLSTWTVRFQLWHLHRAHVLLDGTQEYDLREFLQPSALGGTPIPKRYVRLVSYLLTAFLAKHHRSGVYTPIICLLGSPLPVEPPKNVEAAEAEAPHIRDIAERATAHSKGTRVVGTFRAGFALQAQAAYQHFREGSYSSLPDIVFDLQDLTVGAVDITGAYGPLGQLLDIDVSQHTDSAEEDSLSKKICPRFITENVNNVLQQLFQKLVRQDFYGISPLNTKEIIFLANPETTLTEAFGLVQLKYGLYFSFDVLYLVIAACRVFVHRAVAWAASLIIGVSRFLYSISRRRSFRIAIRGGLWEWRLSRRYLMHYVERLKPRDARWTILLSSLEGPDDAGGVALLLHHVQTVESARKLEVDNTLRKFVDPENYHEAHERIKNLISDELEVEEATSVESSIHRNTWLTWVDHLAPLNLSGFGDADVGRLKTLFFKANPSIVDVDD